MSPPRQRSLSLCGSLRCILVCVCVCFFGRGSLPAVGGRHMSRSLALSGSGSGTPCFEVSVIKGG
ncbi:hypothetical protein BDZ97DRAFT_1845608 [Flammula alnicola]|nr:hypothetical protein BDZ97DRAFT_1884564 [Flammula alnicola]KAF8957572.1 hypothetical protein BDZ97DRAFT_1845608 [Flammula alnicola]